jgi:arylsulfatase A-like enzyme
VYGTDARYAELVRAADAEIGRYRAKSRELGQEAERVYAIVTDHGVADAKQNFDLRALLREKTGMIAERDHATHLAESELDDDPEVWARADAVVVINGNMMNYLYFRDRGADVAHAWSRPLSVEELAAFQPQKAPGPVDVIAALRSAPEVELVIGRRGSGEVAIFDARGEATLAERDGAITYRIVTGDPLGYGRDQTHSRDEWLALTIGTRFPDAPNRLWALINAENVGDLVVTSAPGWDFGQDYELFVGNYRGGHGGLRADQLEVPYVISGRGVRAGVRIERARAEDIGATLFALLGVEAPDGAEGHALREALAE